MDRIQKRVDQWIKNKKDPRSAHWQGGLEAVLELFSEGLEPGRLVPVKPLDPHETPVFNQAFEVVDLSPGLKAAFLPPSIAGEVIPPESADELQRIDKDQPSFKILVERPGKNSRILVAEISEMAKRCGVDIFQEGSFLGNYDFETAQDCLEGITKILRTHIWEKGNWTRSEIIQYTMNWFEKVLVLEKGTVPFDKNRSFLHSPTLIKSNRIDALFFLVHEFLLKQFKDPAGRIQSILVSIQMIPDPKVRNDRFTELAERGILDVLNPMRKWEVIKFDEFTSKEEDQFKNEFSRTCLQLVNWLNSRAR